MSTAIRTVAGPGPDPFIADFKAAASFAEITTTGIFGSVGALFASRRSASGVAATPGVSGSPCQNQLSLALPRCSMSPPRQ